MAAKELEVLVTAAMLLALPVIATWYWRDNRAISWGALGLCVLIPEAASETPSAAVLHLVMAVTAVAVVLQLGIDALKQRQSERALQAEAGEGTRMSDDALLAQAPTPQPPAQAQAEHPPADAPAQPLGQGWPSSAVPGAPYGWRVMQRSRPPVLAAPGMHARTLHAHEPHPPGGPHDSDNWHALNHTRRPQ